ncbi:MAG: indolepyruvate ferredoxin oxidoreductase subunit alpha [Candidatus Limnocylindria bacterium]
MSYVIAQPCVDHNDRSCIEVCPVDCISAEVGVDRKLYVDPDSCIDCGACADACPNEAIFRSDELPAQWTPFARIDATWYRDPQTARATVDQLVPHPG